MKIELEIDSCKQCPHFEAERMFTEDSWEEAYNWFCKHSTPRRKIMGYVEWNDEPEIPEWCPIMVKE